MNKGQIQFIREAIRWAESEISEATEMRKSASHMQRAFGIVKAHEAGKILARMKAKLDHRDSEACKAVLRADEPEPERRFVQRV